MGNLTVSKLRAIVKFQSVSWRTAAATIHQTDSWRIFYVVTGSWLKLLNFVLYFRSGFWAGLGIFANYQLLFYCTVFFQHVKFKKRSQNGNVIFQISITITIPKPIFPILLNLNWKFKRNNHDSKTNVAN